MTDWDDPEENDLFTVEDLREHLVSINEVVEEKLARIRLGVYSEKQDGNLQEVLEEIERILR